MVDMRFKKPNKSNFKIWQEQVNLQKFSRFISKKIFLSKKIMKTKYQKP